jgi:hypothetical protein
VCSTMLNDHQLGVLICKIHKKKECDRCGIRLKQMKLTPMKMQIPVSLLKFRHYGYSLLRELNDLVYGLSNTVLDNLQNKELPEDLLQHMSSITDFSSKDLLTNCVHGYLEKMCRDCYPYDCYDWSKMLSSTIHDQVPFSLIATLNYMGKEK